MLKVKLSIKNFLEILKNFKNGYFKFLFCFDNNYNIQAFTSISSLLTI